MLSKLYTQGNKIITLKNSYHGLAGVCKPTNEADTANYRKLNEPSSYKISNKNIGN
jgi:glutamate-1-semialdehyde aminotransferase